jgi:FixJ family two-component response regulator
MPEQSGEQTLDQLGTARCDIPVVITSGFQAEDAAMLLLKPHVVGFLEKPHTMTNLEMLLATIGQHTPSAKARTAATARHEPTPVEA